MYCPFSTVVLCTLQKSCLLSFHMLCLELNFFSNIESFGYLPFSFINTFFQNFKFSFSTYKSKLQNYTAYIPQILNDYINFRLEQMRWIMFFKHNKTFYNITQDIISLAQVLNLN